MKNITGTYILNKKEVAFSANVPSSWEDLEKHQFARCIEVLHFRKADRYTISASLLALLFGSENWHILRSLPDEYLTALIPLTNFLFEENPPVINFFPELKIRKKVHIAPALDLSNICFGEWCFAHQYYMYYHISQDVMWLNKLIATIYRPIDPDQDPEKANYSGDIREKFNENLIESRTKDVASIGNYMKLGVLTWFSSALREITESRPHVFPARPQIDPDQEQPPIEENDGRTWLTIFRELLGPKWGTPDQLKYTNAMFILDELEDRNIAFEEAKKST